MSNSDLKALQRSIRLGRNRENAIAANALKHFCARIKADGGFLNSTRFTVFHVESL